MTQTSENTEFGTKAWATKNVNCVSGCSHDCLYCYAKRMALRYRRHTSQSWPRMKVNLRVVNKHWRKCDGRIMFPTTHDITPGVLLPCLTTLSNLLRAGNQVLIVTKPHLASVREMCENLQRYNKQILFRFTITSDDDALLKAWEPGAPTFKERQESLQYACEHKFATSVSIEPCLDMSIIDRLIAKIIPYVTDTIWVGIMNGPISAPQALVDRVKRGQTPDRLLKIYEKYGDNPKIHWMKRFLVSIGL